MIWYWYVARDDELMLDLDGGKPGRGILARTRVRLRAAIDSGLLSVKSLHLYPSGTSGHYHAIVRIDLDKVFLDERFVPVFRFMWEMQLGSDLYRSRCNLSRYIDGVQAAGLLIAPCEWEGFGRGADVTCACPAKHDFRMIQSCPAMFKLRGLHGSRSEFGALLKGTRPRKIRLERPGPVDLEQFTAIMSPEE